MAFGQVVGIFQEAVQINGGSFYAGPNNADGQPVLPGTISGTYTSTNPLTLNGSYIKTFKNSGGNVTGAQMNYRVYKQGTIPPAFTSVNLPFGSNLANPGDQQWQNFSININAASLVKQGNATQILEISWTYFYNSPGGGSTTTSSVSTTFFADATLAVELSNFSAVEKKENVLLKWLTASEKDNALFKVERSQNGKDFSTIGEVKGTNAATGSNYSFSDATPNTGVNYYRLNAVDFSGNSEYSKIISVVFDNSIEKKLNISPNPTRDKIIFATGGENTSTVIFDINGRILQTLNNTREISVNELPTGIYFLRVTDNIGNIIGQERFVKL